MQRRGDPRKLLFSSVPIIFPKRERDGNAVQVIRLLQLLAREREEEKKEEEERMEGSGEVGSRWVEEQTREGQTFRCSRRKEEEREEEKERRGVEELVREGRSSNTSSECCSSNKERGMSSKERGISSKERGRSRERQLTLPRVSSLSLGRAPASSQQRGGCLQKPDYQTLSNKPLLRHSLSMHQEPSFHSLSGTSTRKPAHHQKRGQGSSCKCNQCLL